VNIISLFSGSGGLDLGFEQAGYTPIVAYDNEPAAIDTYNTNRQENVAVLADISKLTAEEIYEMVCRRVEYSRDAIVGVVGGPPCQYFSNGNRSTRRDDDPRRLLPISYAKILKDLNKFFDIKFFAFENVEGLTQRAHKTDFEAIVELFKDADFHVFHEVLDAYDFNTPQHRERVFLVGLNKQIYPNADFVFPIGKPSCLTVRDAIEGLFEPVFFEKNLDNNSFPEHPNHWTMQPKSPKFNTVKPDDIREFTRSFRRLSWDKPSYTVAYGHNEIHIHPNEHRRLSIYEAMLLQGFPKTYRLCGNLSEQVSLVSDAVPPPLAKSLAESINQFIAKR